jgi:hypothetical protein
MGMGMPPAVGAPGMPTPGMPSPDGTESDLDTDSFAATDAAAGPNVVGREKR